MVAPSPPAAEIVTGRAVAALLGAGVLGEVVFEALAWLVAPALFGMALQPAFLIAKLADRWVGQDLGYGAAFILHFLAGVVVFPILYRLVFGAAARRRWLSAGVAWGLALWAASEGLLAPLAGLSFMADFGVYTWAVGAAHVAYALTVAAAYPRLLAWMTRPLDGLAPTAPERPG